MTELEKKVFREVFVNKPIMYHSDDCLLKIRDFFEKFSVGYLDFQTGYTHNVIMLNDNLNAYYLHSFNICDRKYNFDLLLQDYKGTIRRKKMNKDFKVGDVVVLENDKREPKDLYKVESRTVTEIMTLINLETKEYLTVQGGLEIRHATLKEQYLVNENVVYLNYNKEEKWFVVGKKLRRNSEFILIEDFNDDLTHVEDKSINIDTVRYSNLAGFETTIWERKPKIKLTDDEVVILKNVNEKYKYIARDKDNDNLSVYTDKPLTSVQEDFYCVGKGSFQYFKMYNHLFQNITFESGSHLIADLIKENE